MVGVDQRQGNYTVSQKNAQTIFCDNFGKHWPILIIHSLLHSEMNYRRSRNTICHFA